MVFCGLLCPTPIFCGYISFCPPSPHISFLFLPLLLPPPPANPRFYRLFCSHPTEIQGLSEAGGAVYNKNGNWVDAHSPFSLLALDKFWPIFNATDRIPPGKTGFSLWITQIPSYLYLGVLNSSHSLISQMWFSFTVHISGYSASGCEKWYSFRRAAHKLQTLNSASDCEKWYSFRRAAHKL